MPSQFDPRGPGAILTHPKGGREYPPQIASILYQIHSKSKPRACQRKAGVIPVRSEGVGGHPNPSQGGQGVSPQIAFILYQIHSKNKPRACKKEAGDRDIIFGARLLLIKILTPSWIPNRIQTPESLSNYLGRSSHRDACSGDRGVV